MLKIINIGMNHETASVELRECLAAEADNTLRALVSMRNLEVLREGLFLSTCNRVEALIITDAAEEAKKSVILLMSKLGGIPVEDFLASLYVYEDMDAVKHIFSVASSLDSMVVGEPQILGQIKEAYARATKEKTSGVILNRLMHRAFHVAKRVRSETDICGAAVSISYAAVELAKKIFHLLEGKKVLLIGAGEMAEVAAKHLLANGVSAVIVANRTFERAVEVAKRFNALPVSFDEIGSQLLDVDIVITSTASPEYVITHSQVKKSLRKRRNRPLFFIDIAVPRDVQPEVNDLNNVYLYNIDDLKGVIEFNMAQRKEEAVKAERIVEEEVTKFEKWLKTLAVVPTIISLRNKAESIIRAEFGKSGAVLGELTPAQSKAIETLTRSIVEKILNDPIVFLKGNAGRSTRDTYLDLTKRLFSLDDIEAEELMNNRLH
ncbi:MAG: glutamyl-tRNA reductase [Proteobacteria bacterium]|nr:glutamyl-tRNA reductase [Desulfobacteraceae bacterium]MBU1905125.1 glutamyl-tRNA reductase [Pseudomonadota bacterium]